MEVSLIFWDNAQRRKIEPGAPSVAERLEGITQLCRKGVTVALRLDPLFPRLPLPSKFWDMLTPEDYGAVTAHTTEDIDNLFSTVAAAGVRKVVSKALKLPFGRCEPQNAFKKSFQSLFEAAGGGKAISKGPSWRLPSEYVNTIWSETDSLAKKHGLELVHCAHNLCHTR